MRSEEKAKESCGMQLSDFVVPPGIELSVQVTEYL